MSKEDGNRLILLGMSPGGATVLEQILGEIQEEFPDDVNLIAEIRDELKYQIKHNKVPPPPPPEEVDDKPAKAKRNSRSKRQ